MNSNSITSIFEMTSLCPHLFQEYLHRVSEIIRTYKPQILVLVKYRVIAESLLSRHVIKKREHVDILKTKDEKEQIEKLILILQKRMWGLENFITALIEHNVDSWLAEELFGAYVRHLVVKMKEIQAKNNICSCFHGGNNSVLYRSWLQALTKFDGWLTDIGGALGFLTLTMHPVKSVLSFINERLPITRKRIVLINPAETLNDSDSESDEDAELTDPEPETSSIPKPPVPQELLVKTTVSGSSLDFTQYLYIPQQKDYRHRIQSPIKRCNSTPELRTSSTASTSSSNSVFENFDDQEFYNASMGARVYSSRPRVEPETPEDFHIDGSDPYDVNALLEELELGKPRPTSLSTWTLYNSESEDETLFNVVSKVSAAVVSSACLAPATSVSTQTSPIPSPESGMWSLSFPESTQDHDDVMLSSLDAKKSCSPSISEEETDDKSQKFTPSIVKPAPVKRRPAANSSTAITSRKSKSTSTSKPPTSYSRPSTFVLKKPSSLNPSSSAPKPSTQKVATITPRQRVLDAYKAKKANAPPPPPPVHEERLKPQDYTFQVWSNRVGRKDGQSQGGSSVA